MGAVQRSQWTSSNAAEVVLVEGEKGSLTCLPNWHASQSRAELLQGKDLLKAEETAGWPKRRCHVSLLMEIAGRA
jgi:hypothetical protein